jgi:hypothetical protein
MAQHDFQISGYLNGYTSIESLNGAVPTGRGVRRVRNNVFMVTDAAKARLRETFSFRLDSNLEA